MGDHETPNVRRYKSPWQDPQGGTMKYLPVWGNMVDPERLSTATGQLGPKCAKTGKPLKFSEAIVHDGEYLSYEAYLEVTGAESSTEPKPVPGPRME